MSDSFNRYAPPQAQVADVYSDPRSFQPVKLFSAEGRIGRVRYLAYSFVGSLALIFAFALFAGLSGLLHMPGLIAVGGIALYGAVVVFTVLLTIQRCHDCNWSGWMCLLYLVPFVSLIFLFMPGTRGANRFGAPPPPNSTGVNALAILMCLVLPLFGILAAIALPAYQDYTKRARQQQPSSSSSSWVQPQQQMALLRKQ
jgi:uncharacterized membrane protein YhaH (DUF805 family)